MDIINKLIDIKRSFEYLSEEKHAMSRRYKSEYVEGINKGSCVAYDVAATRIGLLIEKLEDAEPQIIQAEDYEELIEFYEGVENMLNEGKSGVARTMISIRKNIIRDKLRRMNDVK